MKYRVEIVESLAYKYAVEAESKEDAENKVSTLYSKGILPMPENQAEFVACEHGDCIELPKDEEGIYYEVT